MVEAKGSSPGSSDAPDKIFKNITYYMIGNIPDTVKSLLNDGGAKQDFYLSQIITHVIADDPEEDEVNEARDLFELTVVKSEWVVLSAKCANLLPTNCFSPIPEKIFNDVVACPSQLTKSDAEKLWAYIKFHGGCCQQNLNKKVTHLICSKAQGSKYEAAMKHKDILIVTPDWVTDSVAQKKKLRERIYHPELIRPPTPPKPPTPPPPNPPLLTPKTEPVTSPPAMPHGVPQVRGSGTLQQLQNQVHGIQLQQQNPKMMQQTGGQPRAGHPEGLNPVELHQQHLQQQYQHRHPIAPGQAMPNFPQPMPQQSMGQPFSSSPYSMPGNVRPMQSAPRGMHPMSMHSSVPVSGGQVASMAGPMAQMQGGLHSMSAPMSSVPGTIPSMAGPRASMMGPMSSMPGIMSSMAGPMTSMGGMMLNSSAPPGTLQSMMPRYTTPLQSTLPPVSAQDQARMQFSSASNFVPGQMPMSQAHPPMNTNTSAAGPVGPQGAMRPGQLLPRGMPLPPRGHPQAGLNMPIDPRAAVPPPGTRFAMQPGVSPALRGSMPGPGGVMQAPPGGAMPGMIQAPPGTQQGLIPQPSEITSTSSTIVPPQPGIVGQQTSRPHDLVLPTCSTPPPGQPDSGSNSPKTPKGETSRTKEALARMVSNRLHGRDEPSPQMMSPLPPGLRGMRPPASQVNPTMSNGVPRSPRAKMSHLVGNLNRPVQQTSSPGRSALAHQLQQTLGVRMPGQGVPSSNNQELYFGHDPIETVPEDLCLMGCVFYMTDYQRTVEAYQHDTWKKVIEQHGGSVDDSYSQRVTHLLCEHQKSDVFQMAVRDHKRVVTAQWLNDVIVKKRMVPPWMSLHFPSPYGFEKPCKTQRICISNFENEERQEVKNMIISLGAKYTSYMTRANSVLICKRTEGEKYKKAVEWQIPIVNIHFLNDLILGNLQALKLPVHPRYQQFDPNTDFRIETWRVAFMMEGWKVPLRIHREAWKRFSPSQLLRQHGAEKRKPDGQSQADKKPRLQSSLSLNGEGVPVVLMTGIPRNRAEMLEQQIEKLGGHVSNQAKGCSHMVCTAITRTFKFISAISVVKHVVTPEWIEHSALENKFLDENNFVLRDVVNEVEFGLKLDETLSRAKEKPVFKDLTFYLSPSIVPHRHSVREIIENSGGVVVDKRPSINKMKEYKTPQGTPSFIVIGCDHDLDLLTDVIKRNLPIYNVEFIFTSVMRQELAMENFLLS